MPVGGRVPMCFHNVRLSGHMLSRVFARDWPALVSVHIAVGVVPWFLDWVFFIGLRCCQFARRCAAFLRKRVARRDVIGQCQMVSVPPMWVVYGIVGTLCRRGSLSVVPA